MKGIKGERKYYGIKSPFHALYVAAGVMYQGTRGTNGYQKAPWYMYESAPKAELPDVLALVDSLMKAGWKLRNDLDGNPQSFPKKGVKSGGATTECFELETYHQGVLHTMHLIAYQYAKKPERNYVALGEITYPG
jgi:hypothetical protein